MLFTKAVAAAPSAPKETMEFITTLPDVTDVIVMDDTDTPANTDISDLNKLLNSESKSGSSKLLKLTELKVTVDSTFIEEEVVVGTVVSLEFKTLPELSVLIWVTDPSEDVTVSTLESSPDTTVSVTVPVVLSVTTVVVVSEMTSVVNSVTFNSVPEESFSIVVTSVIPVSISTGAAVSMVLTILPELSLLVCVTVPDVSVIVSV